jgi:MFS family permease
MSLNEYYIIGIILIIVGFVIFIWRYKISDEEIKRISERKTAKYYEPSDKYLKELEKRKEPTFFAFIIILLLASFYFYRVFTSSSTMGFWGYFLIAVLLIAGVDAFGGFFKSEKKYQENSKELNKDQKKNLQYSQSSFDDFIAGRMSLAKCFWLYHVLIGFVLGFLCAYFAEIHQQYWLYIFPFAYYAVVTVAVWNCATLYAKDKLDNKQPYGWAIAAKISIVLNAVGLIGQIILMLNKN